GHLLPEGVLRAADRVAELPDRFPDRPADAGHLRWTEDEQGDRQEDQELELILEHARTSSGERRRAYGVSQDVPGVDYNSTPRRKRRGRSGTTEPRNYRRPRARRRCGAVRAAAEGRGGKRVGAPSRATTRTPSPSEERRPEPCLLARNRR